MKPHPFNYIISWCTVKKWKREVCDKHYCMQQFILLNILETPRCALQSFFFKSFYFIHFKCKLITDWRTYWIVNWILLFILRNLSKFHKYIELWQGKPKCFPFQPSTKTDQSVSFSPYWSWASMNWIVFSKSKTKWFIWFTIFQIIFFRNIK